MMWEFIIKVSKPDKRLFWDFFSCSLTIQRLLLIWNHIVFASRYSIKTVPWILSCRHGAEQQDEIFINPRKLAYIRVKEANQCFKSYRLFFFWKHLKKLIYYGTRKKQTKQLRVLFVVNCVSETRVKHTNWK